MRDAIAANLARDTIDPSVGTIRIEGTLASEGTQWVLTVRTELPSGPVQREVRGSSCAELGDAAGLIIAVDLDPLRVVETTRLADAPLPEPLPDPLVEPTPTPEPVPTPVQDSPPPEPTPAPAPSKAPPRRGLDTDLRIGLLGEFGSLGAVRGGAWIGIGISGRRFRADFAAQYWAPRRVFAFPDQPRVGVAIQQGGVAARACFVPYDRALSLASCAGIEAGVARGSGVGLQRSVASTPPWVAAAVGQELSWNRGRRLGLWVALDAMFHIVRPQWSIDGLGVAARTAPVGARLVMGPSVRF